MDRNPSRERAINRTLDSPPGFRTSHPSAAADRRTIYRTPSQSGSSLATASSPIASGGSNALSYLIAGYDEAGTAGLHSDSDDTDVPYTTPGIRAATDISLGTMTGKLHGMLGWRHAFGDTTTHATHAFTGSDAFTVAGMPIAQDAALIEAGFDVAIRNAASLGFAYQGQFGDGATQNGFSARLNVQF